MRITRRPDGRLALGRAEPGRGAWVCAGSEGCFERAVRRRAFGRALRAPVDPEAVDELRGVFAGAAPGRGEGAPP